MKRLFALFVSLVVIGCSSAEVPSNGQNGQGGTPGGGTPVGGCYDRDNDGYQSKSCNPSTTGVPRGGDCDDYSNAKSPGNREDCSNSIDNDCDGLIGARDPDCMKECEDADRDGYQSAACNSDPRARGGDCDDNNPMVNPGRTEQCGNMIDDDCKGGDLACLANCQDRDRDGFGVGSGCYGPDCNDNDPNINPWATDICGNNIDEDCDNVPAQCSADCVDQDGDGYGTSGTTCLGIDCNDQDARIHPGARELPGDNIDQDCSGSDLPRGIACSGDRDGDGYGPTGAPPCLGLDCDEGDPRIHQGRTDACDNGIDEDCSGADNICNPTMMLCPGGRAPTIEICNGIDDDCDGQLDECTRRGHTCVDGNCVGTVGAPCGNDGECAADMNLHCNLDLRECRVRDGEICQASGQCNPTATCEVGLCGSDSLCYQALSGPCEDACDCASTYSCKNNHCVECQSDFACTNDTSRPMCSEGGFCVADVTFGFTPGDLCENTCGEGIRDPDETPWINDGYCDEAGHPDNTTGASCSPGTDCADCGPCVGCDANNSSTNMEDTLSRVLYEIIKCWNRSTSSPQPQGCARLSLPSTLTANGQTVYSIGGRDALEDAVCDGDGLLGSLFGGCNFDNLEALGFSESDAETACDIWGCGVNLSNIEWEGINALRPGTNDMCIFYSPSRSGFNAFDTNRNAIIVDSCSTSDLF